MPARRIATIVTALLAATALFGDSTAIAQAAAVVAPDQPGLPAWMTPGTRITYHGGNSTIQGAKQAFKPNPNGTWTNAAGQTFSPEDLAGSSGGVGYVQLTVVAADQQVVAADRRDFLIIDPQRGTCQLNGASAIVGNVGRLGSFWIHPAELQRMAQMHQGGVTVQRVQYQIGGQAYDALSILTQSPGAYASTLYDLASGLLLSESTSNAGEASWAPDINGTTSSLQPGASQLSHLRLLAIRPTQLPWANDPLPAFVVQGQTFTWSGQQTVGGIGGPGGGNFGANVSSVVQVGQRVGGIALCRQTMPVGHYGLPPQTASVDRVVGCAMPGTIFIAPQRLAQLQPNQPLDADPITGYRTIFAGQQNGIAMIVEQGTADAMQYGYDFQTGMLVGVSTTKDVANIGRQTTQLQLMR